MAGRTSVLIVDDSRSVIAHLEGVLRDREDVEVVGRARDGAEAVDSSRAAPPDLVLMDISMPRVDGIDATGQIRAFEAAAGLPRVPVIALTAHAMAGDAARFLAAGMDRYLTKPLRRAALVEVMNALTGVPPGDE